MIASYFITLFLILFITSRNQAKVVEWDHTRIDVSKGDSVNVTCTASLHSYFDVVRIQVVYDHGKNYTISDGKDVKKPFSKMGRLKILHDIENQNIFHTTLVFTDVRGEDSGTYSCLKLGDPSVAEIHLHVHVPIKSVIWSNHITLPDKLLLSKSQNDEIVTLHLKESEEIIVSCFVLVEGTTNSPKVRVLLNEEEDVTSYFTEFEGPIMLQEKDGQERLQSITRLTYSTFYPAPLIHGHNLTCMAEINGGNVQQGHFNWSSEIGPMAAYALLHIEFAPVLSCQKYLIQVHVHDNISVDCFLFSNPQSMLNWSRSLSSSSHPEVHLSQKKIGHHKYQVKFDAIRLEEAHMGSYHLVATNDISSQEVTLKFNSIRLFNGNEPEVFVRFDSLTGSTSSQYSILSTIILLFLSVLFCLILH